MQGKETGADTRDILQKIDKAVLPVIIPKERYQLKEEVVTESFGDMTFGYHLTTMGQERIYAKPVLETALSAAGFHLKEAALRNYSRDLKVRFTDCMIPGCIQKLEIVLLIGNLDMEAALICPDVLQELAEICGGSYDVLGVASIGMVLYKNNKGTGIRKQCRNMADKILGRESSSPDIYHYDVRNRKLEKTRPEEDCCCACLLREIEDMPVVDADERKDTRE